MNFSNIGWRKVLQNFNLVNERVFPLPSRHCENSELSPSRFCRKYSNCSKLFPKVAYALVYVSSTTCESTPRTISIW
jgi:hypothetical protein